MSDYQVSHEQGEVKSKAAGIALTIGAVSIAVIFVFSIFLYKSMENYMLDSQEQNSGSAELAEVRAMETELLTSTGWADTNKTRVRIPVQEAARIYLKRNQ